MLVFTEFSQHMPDSLYMLLSKSYKAYFELDPGAREPWEQIWREFDHGVFNDYESVWVDGFISCFDEAIV